MSKLKTLSSILTAGLLVSGMAAAQQTETSRLAAQAESARLSAQAETERRTVQAETERQAAQAESARQTALQAATERRDAAERAAEQRLAERSARAANAEERERARQELEAARRELERAARELAIASQPASAGSGNGAFNYTRILGTGSRAQIGALVTPAEDGALVTSITPGGSAEQAGLKVGDVIERVGDVSMAENAADASGGVFSRFYELLDDVEPGDTVHLVVERAGQMLEFDVEPSAESGLSVASIGPLSDRLLALSDQLQDLHVDVTAVPDVSVVTAAPAPNVRVFRSFNLAASPWGDMELVPITAGLGRYFGTDEGLLVVGAPDDATIGIEAGDVILSISGRTPNSPEHAIRILSSFEPGETITFALMRDGSRESVDYLVPERQVNAAPVRVLPPR